jgi:hypothetical protein
MRTMFDAVTPSALPRSAVMVAGYVDGIYANLAAIRSEFPNAIEVSIAVAWSDRAQVLDVESGDATPEQAVTWCTQTMKDVPNSLLTVYCDAANWPAVRAAFQAAGVSEPQYWIAAYDNSPTIPTGAIAHQYASTDAYDTSVVADYWPGVDPVPPTPPTPPEDAVTLADAQLFVETLMGTKVTEVGDAQSATRTFLQVMAFMDEHYGALASAVAEANAAVKSLSEQVTALQAAVAKLAPPA